MGNYSNFVLSRKKYISANEDICLNALAELLLNKNSWFCSPKHFRCITYYLLIRVIGSIDLLYPSRACVGTHFYVGGDMLFSNSRESIVIISMGFCFGAWGILHTIVNLIKYIHRIDNDENSMHEICRKIKLLWEKQCRGAWELWNVRMRLVHGHKYSLMIRLFQAGESWFTWQKPIFLSKSNWNSWEAINAMPNQNYHWNIGKE